ncbi:bifunctional IPC transferase and DIPP synthase [bacterium BMS3Bbin03]|nr:bifunctional IPC transferase and DIPP synthase [bacterium BMS3Bbin03]
MKALILAAGLGKRQKENGDSKPLIPLLGLSFIERVILTAKKSGIKEFQIVIGYKGKRIQKYLGNGEKLGVNVDYIYNDEWRKGNGISVLKAKDYIQKPFILLMADHLFDYKILLALQKQTIEDDGCILCVDKDHHKYLDVDDATKVLIEESQIKDIGKQLDDYNGIDTGIFLCTPAIFDALEVSIRNGNDSLSAGIKALAKRHKMKAFDISDKYWLDVDDNGALKNAKSLLFEKLKKNTDGPVSRILNRPISSKISELLLKTNITPNQISLISFILGFFGALFFYFGNYIYLVIGGLLVQLSSIIDGCDGEVARLKLVETEYGGWFDSVLDRYADAIIIFGMIHGHWLLHNDIIIWTVGFIALMGSFLNSYTADKYDVIFRKRIKVNRMRMGRDVRLFLIFIGALSNQILITLAILAVISNFEAIRRLVVLRFKYA